MCLYWEHRHFAADCARLVARVKCLFTKYRFGRGRIKFNGARRFRVRGVRYGARRR